MAIQVVHLRHAAGESICGVKNKLYLRVVRNQNKVTCRNCLKLMRLHRHTVEEDMARIRTERPEHEMTSLLRKQRITDLEAQIESLKADLRRTEEQLDKAVQHADAIQQLAAEGKDPLTGEEPEFWAVLDYDESENVPVILCCTASKDETAREAARRTAEERAVAHPKQPVWVAAVFDHAICEVLPVAWKRKSSEAEAQFDHDEDVPF